MENERPKHNFLCLRRSWSRFWGLVSCLEAAREKYCLTCGPSSPPQHRAVAQHSLGPFLRSLVVDISLSLSSLTSSLVYIIPPLSITFATSNSHCDHFISSYSRAFEGTIMNDKNSM